MPDTFIVQLEEGAKLPTRTFSGDAGFDLYVFGDHTIPPGGHANIPTGVRVQFAEGWWGRITGRSSTYHKRGLLVIEGVIDQGYTGPLYVCVRNPNLTPVEIANDDRLGQLIPHRTADIVLEAGKIGLTERGSRGFGSSGA